MNKPRGLAALSPEERSAFGRRVHERRTPEERSAAAAHAARAGHAAGVAHVFDSASAKAAGAIGGRSKKRKEKV